MTKYNKIWLILSMIFVLAAGTLEISHPYWGDESHFVETIKIFNSSPLTEVVKDYPEVTPPLVYITYSVWGKLFGFELVRLRVLSLIISLIFLIILYRCVKTYITNEKLCLILCGLMLINPYMWGLSVFVFTDMLTLLFAFTAIYLFRLDKPGFTALFLGLSLLCRQYAAIFIAAVCLFVLLRAVITGEKRNLLKYGIYIFISVMPFIILMIIWKGPSPPSGIRKFIPVKSLYWNLSAFTTYLSFSALYILPLLVVFSRKLWTCKRFLIPAFIAGCLYLIAPVKVSEVTRIQNNLDTVGLAHKFLISLAGSGLILNIILYIFLSLGLWVLIIMLREDILVLRSGKVPYFILFSALIYSFLLIMPLSYQVWEKYLIMIIPIISIRLGFLFPGYLGKNHQSAENTVSA